MYTPSPYVHGKWPHVAPEEMHIPPAEADSIVSSVYSSVYGKDGHDEPALQPPSLMQSSANDLDVDGQPILNVLERRQHSSPLARPTLESSSTGQKRQLNVTDAMTYMDGVKLQFHDNPDVYNRFLNIMKEYRDGSIDTPGLVDQVSSLFAGHPALVLWFNVFLPDGYRIGYPIRALEMGMATVATPIGTTTQSASVPMAPEVHVNTQRIEQKMTNDLSPPEQIGIDDYVSMLQAFDVSSNLKIGRLRASGGFADVYEGQISLRGQHALLSLSALHDQTESEIKIVAIKRFRVFLESNRDFAKAIKREVRVWSRLEHPNILPLLGYVVLDDLPSPVSEWMDNGALTHYWKARPEAKTCPMAQGIAAGLTYLHAKEVVHADLRCDNILVAPDGRPLLCDFGISRILANSVTVAGTSTLKGSLRWMAVELLNIEDSDDQSASHHSFHTKASDVWAYGMVIYELLSGEVPFYHHRSDGAVVAAIVSDRQPLKPKEWRDENESWLWDVCTRCWAKSPNDRPKMSQLRLSIELKRATVKGP